METTNIKELIEQRARQTAIDKKWNPDSMETRRVANTIISSYTEGANMILELYQGITPETVKLLLEAAKEVNRTHSQLWDVLQSEGIKTKVTNAINQANKELNNL